MSKRPRNILLGISGGIAAYKTPDLVRRLRDSGADVQIVLTRSAEEFVTETSLQAVSGKPIRSNIWDKEAEAAMGHIELARWADVVLIAPATAEMISRLASGGAPDLLTTVCLATEAQIVVAPAMNRVMWANPAVQENRRKLESRGIRILGPGVGSQACGEEGAGRMLSPDEIAAAIMDQAVVTMPAVDPSLLAGRKVMVTAGPTREPIDPVRYISNRSSGKMGYAIAEAARDAGADVTLLSGPVNLLKPPGIRVVEFETAQDLYNAAHANIEDVDIFIAAAAVADYRLARVATSKIKKSTEQMTLQLAKAPDTLAAISALDKRPFCVGFAAETNDVSAYARQKLEQKKLDMIVANKVGPNLAFDSDENAVVVFWNGGSKRYPTSAKSSLAIQLIRLVAERFAAAASFESSSTASK